MSKIFVNYPKCSTCKRAEKFLKENNVEFVNRNIVEENPTAEELSLWMDKSGLEPRKFFNTSGVLYREMNLKDKIKTMSKEEMIEILSTNGMLVKRPLLVTEDIVLVGFKEENYKEIVLELCRKEDQLFDYSMNNWCDIREGKENPRNTVAWCVMAVQEYFWHVH